jgi:cytochrome c oxidase cbb3-type subunit 4
MTYENLAFASQMIALALFGAVMLGVVIYAFRPGNKARFQAAAYRALENDDHCGEGDHGRP